MAGKPIIVIAVHLLSATQYCIQHILGIEPHALVLPSARLARRTYYDGWFNSTACSNTPGLHRQYRFRALSGGPNDIRLSYEFT